MVAARNLFSWLCRASSSDLPHLEPVDGPTPEVPLESPTTSPKEGKAKRRSKSKRQRSEHRHVSCRGPSEMSARNQAQTLVAMSGFPMPFLP
ncbi:unnamed protein product [Effrenium voratum]|uniref:Uncharacterized protein n=1 Tax=Effrenium voratum TaxID=2562239 RepID=A0AA36IHM9_9DINO|nr:unnamed protein product [Effrenium voratum]